MIYTPLILSINYISLVIAIVVALAIFILFIRNIRIVPQATTFVIERLGGYHATWQTGIHVKVPFIDRVANIISLKEQVADFQPQAVITKDNVTMQIDTVVFFQIVDSKLYTYGIENPIMAIENLSATTLRNLIGDLELDETLTSRDVINTNMRQILDVATDPWGIKVNRVELKNIIPPREIQQAMERQMKAEREKREKILIAEGMKEAAIREAEGDKEAAILRADAKKEQAIREAEGQAQAILKVQDATAKGLQMIKDVKADEGLIALRGLETMAKIGDGRATKIIIPSSLQGLAGLAQTLQTILNEPDPNADVNIDKT
ncbi:MAG TPA: SPFH/Band 7/PHB domain protein [Clostridiaceae bacterium]|nr:SPFH/Band 7/PHB domain protein [Clostridiaceae bacterium]